MKHRRTRQKRSRHKHRGRKRTRHKRSAAGKASSSSSSSNTLSRLHDILDQALITIEAEEEFHPEESIKCGQLRDQFNDLKNQLVEMDIELRRVCKPIPPRHPPPSKRGRGTKKASRFS